MPEQNPLVRTSRALPLLGPPVAAKLREEASREAKSAAMAGHPPHLRVILLGSHPASETYVAAKTRAAREEGLTAETVRLPSGTPPARLFAEIERANQDEEVDGLLIQMPLEPGHDRRRVFDRIDPLKDVDGFHPENVGRLHQGRPRFVPCTPAGILALLDAYDIEVAGRRAVILGRSDIVGKPLTALLSGRDATVTLCHSKTRNLAGICREAEILVVAVGRPGFINHDFVRPGAAVIDVGINRLDSLDAAPENLRASPRLRQHLMEKGRIVVGDVDYDAVSAVAGWITPVPGGVGPLTVAMLLKNTVKAARLHRAREEERK